MGISIDLDVTMCAIALIVLFVTVCVVLLVRRRRVKRCPSCGTKLARKTKHCTSCGAPLVDVDRPGVTPGAPSSQCRAAQVELVAVHGPLASRRFPIPQSGLTIGRHRAATTSINFEPSSITIPAIFRNTATFFSPESCSRLMIWTRRMSERIYASIGNRRPERTIMKYSDRIQSMVYI